MAVNANGAAGWGMPPMGSASTPSAMNGWGLGQFGQPSQSITPLSPQQTQQIQQTTAAMQQPGMTQPAAPATQQNAMMQALMNPGGGGGVFANSPTYGGGNVFTGANGGNAANPLPGLTAADYG
jgi:hypothetical protein